MAGRRILCLADIDGTLAEPMQRACGEVLDALARLRASGVCIATVGGSDFAKQRAQLGEDVLQRFDYCFAENGLVAYKAGELLATQSLAGHMGEARLQEVVDWCLRYIADLRIPVKRGCFVEYRAGMLNVSPIGRNCSRAERDAFEAYDAEAGIRRRMVRELHARFPELRCSIGGQISFDVFPHGWDKTYCLRFVEHAFDELHFFGDRTQPGGNDHEIATDPRVISHTVTGPADTLRLLRETFGV